MFEAVRERGGDRPAKDWSPPRRQVRLRELFGPRKPHHSEQSRHNFEDCGSEAEDFRRHELRWCLRQRLYSPPGQDTEGRASCCTDTVFLLKCLTVLCTSHRPTLRSQRKNAQGCVRYVLADGAYMSRGPGVY